MPCYHPIKGYISRRVNPLTGKRSIVFNPREGFPDLVRTIPCGQCIGCRLERSRQWAIRCVHEASLHKSSVFITLTYDDSSLPASGSLVKSDFQRFIKRLRKRFSGQLIRYFHCGEYGETTLRPHYHAILFGISFDDRMLFRESPFGNAYVSKSLTDIWGLGFTTLGDVTFESCAYVARYCLKKRTGRDSDKYYQRVIDETGEIVQVLPEYTTMSLKPAIGRLWYDKFSSDVFPSDEVILRGRPMKPPKYYARLYEISNPVEMELIKLSRIRDGARCRADAVPERLEVREKCKLAQVQSLKRSKVS